MLTEKGQAKIMDFGLAKLAWAADLTKTATTMGTLAYMSPEQTRGDAVDHRTDIWSLGVVLYEMLAGQLPFTGDETPGIVYSILNKDPAPLTSIRPDISRPIVQVVIKALEKDPSRRYQKIQELIQDFKASAPLIFPKAEKDPFLANLRGEERFQRLMERVKKEWEEFEV